MASEARHLLVAVSAIFVLWSGAAVANAAPSAADRETARTMMQEGRDLRDKGDLKGALQRFQAADGIMHVPTTGFEVATTQVALGLLVEARDTVAGIRATPAKPDDPEPFHDARKKADALDASLDARVPRLVVVVTGARAGASLTVTIDGSPSAAAASGLPTTIDPGHHVVAAKTDAAAGSESVDLREGERRQVEIKLAAKATAASGPQEPAPVPQASAPVSTPSAKSHSPTVLTYVGFAVAAAGAVVGGITGGMSISKTQGLAGECGPSKQCGQGTPGNDYAAANTLALVSDVSFVVAGAGAVLAVVTLVVGHGRTEPTAAMRVVPWVSLGSAGVRASF